MVYFTVPISILVGVMRLVKISVEVLEAHTADVTCLPMAPRRAPQVLYQEYSLSKRRLGTLQSIGLRGHSTNWPVL